jgi:hypothetical protein
VSRWMFCYFCQMYIRRKKNKSGSICVQIISKMDGEIKIESDKDKFESDKIWDGLKGYVTNCKLKPEKLLKTTKTCGT